MDQVALVGGPEGREVLEEGINEEGVAPLLDLRANPEARVDTLG